jgi:acetoin utilization protein AcuB
MDLTTTARELMTANPLRVRANVTLERAFALLQELDVRHLPIVDADEQVIGILSDRDFRDLASLEGKVADVMSSDVAAIEAEDSVDEVLELMLERRVGAVPVVDHEGALIGIVSYVDVLRRVRDDLAGRSEP